jgi:site-specific recombinase XerD
MFETLFTCPGALRRHREGPLAVERAAYLSELQAKGMARGTILHRSSYCLCIAVELQRWPPNHCFDEDEVEALATAWAAERAACGRASSPRWPKEGFRFAAMDFLRSLGRLRRVRTPEAGRYDTELAEFIASQQEGRWQSEATCRSARWQITRFLTYLEQRGVALSDVAATDVDVFYQHMTQRWGRSSLRTSAKMLRTWFVYCEARGWVRSGLADAVLLPRIYRHESLPLGPTWDTVGLMLVETSGDDPASIRDHAIILLLAVYGLRSGEVRQLCLDDIDWPRDRIRFVRSKSRCQEIAPLEPRVGNAIARYLRDGRPKTDNRVVFLTLRAPHRPLSAGGLYHVVERHLCKNGSPKKGRGPHGLRRACARHLVESGRSFKEVGDHLGHQSPDATRFYAKVDLVSLRRVAFDDLGGLA